jgi:hypothetical protein
MSSELKLTREVMPLLGINRDLKLGDILPSEDLARIQKATITRAFDEFVTVECRYFVRPKKEATHA